MYPIWRQISSFLFCFIHLENLIIHLFFFDWNWKKQNKTKQINNQQYKIRLNPPRKQKHIHPIHIETIFFLLHCTWPRKQIKSNLVLFSFQFFFLLNSIIYLNFKQHTFSSIDWLASIWNRTLKFHMFVKLVFILLWRIKPFCLDW